MNQTLVECVTSILSDSNLPKKFWAEVLAIATYIWNRSLSKALKGMTSYEAWTDAKPNGSDFKSVCVCLLLTYIIQMNDRS